MGPVRAGKITIEIGEPYPCWCSFKHNDYGGLIFRLHHRELSDLKYAAEKAMHEVSIILDENTPEILPDMDCDPA